MKTVILILALGLFFQWSNAQKPTFTDLDYVGNGNQQQFLDLYIPDSLSQPAPLVIFIHGGGWSGGSKGNPMGFCKTLFQNGYIVADINYRLSGESIFPAQIYDCKAAVRWLKTQAAQYNIDTCRIAVTGSSAGGHLAALLGTSGGVESLEDLGQGSITATSNVHAVIPFYGPTDFLQMNSHVPLTPPDSCTNPIVHDTPDSFETKLLGCQISLCPDRAKEANPMTYIDATDPPFTIFHGSYDCSVPPHQSILLDSALTSFGVYSSLEILPHVGHAFSPDPTQQLEMLNFLNEKLSVCTLTVTAIENEHNSSANFIVYPNPATETIRLQTHDEEIKSIKLFNANGQFVQQYSTSEISLVDMPNGIYFVITRTDKSIYTTKIIKQ